jgi:hypothetical protein
MAAGWKFGPPWTIETTSLGELTGFTMLLNIRPFTVSEVPGVNVVRVELTKTVSADVTT